RQALHAQWSWNGAQVLAVRRHDTHAGGTTAHVDASFLVDGAAVTGAVGQRDQLSLTRERAVRLDIERNQRRAIGHIEGLLVRTEDDAVGAQVLPVPGDHAVRV